MSTPLAEADAPDSAITPPDSVAESFPNTTEHPPSGAPSAVKKGGEMTRAFGCFDCNFRSDSPREMAKHCAVPGHRRIRPCIPCALRFPSKEELDSHRAEVDIPAHRYCGSAQCNTIFSTIALFQAHCRDNHDFLPPLVSPEVRKVRREIARGSKWEASIMIEERRIWAKEKKKLKQFQALDRKRQMLERRQALLKMGPVECHVCSKKLGTPAAYAMHLESGTHHHVDRYAVTQAVHMLDVIPPITLAASIENQSSAEIESPPSSSISPLTSVPSSPLSTNTDGSWIVLREGSALSRSVRTASPFSSITLSTEASSNTLDTISSPGPAVTFIPSNISESDILHGCVLCGKTFRTSSRLAAHMNSPAHDADAFKCPNGKCGQQFALVSGLIQHLESGKCNLASASEIFEQFASLTARFSRYITA